MRDNFTAVHRFAFIFAKKRKSCFVCGAVNDIDGNQHGVSIVITDGRRRRGHVRQPGRGHGQGAPGQPAEGGVGVGGRVPHQRVQRHRPQRRPDQPGRCACREATCGAWEPESVHCLVSPCQHLGSQCILQLAAFQAVCQHSSKTPFWRSQKCDWCTLCLSTMLGLAARHICNAQHMFCSSVL